MNLRWGLVLLSSLSLLLACGGGGSGTGEDKDTKAADSQADVATPDSEQVDFKPNDGAGPDSLDPDGAKPDTALPDGSIPDGQPPDTEPECSADEDCDASAMMLAPCARLVCNQSTFLCEVGAQVDGTPCDDGDPCTGGDSCQAGKCEVGSTPLCECGDGTCNGSETCETCGVDCGKCSCCDVPHGPGCNDPAVNKCVCQQEPDCCLTEWQDVCRSIAATTCGLVCDAFCGDGECDANETFESCEKDCWWDVCGDGHCWDPMESCEACPQDCGFCEVCGNGFCSVVGSEDCDTCPQDCGTCNDSCCVAHAVPGCADDTVESCVCGNDAFCCEEKWDYYCVLQVYELPCGTCQHFCGDGVCQDLWDETCANCAMDCGVCAVCGDGLCENHWPAVSETCDVCAEDCGACPYCGDGTCGSGETCGDCPSDCGECPHECCLEKDEPGCASLPDVQTCVCEQDAWCCEQGWDDQCAAEALPCGLVCPNRCGDGACGWEETCLTCEQDCGSCKPYCCAGDPEIGCLDSEVSACVCSKEPLCCEPGGWDFACVLIADGEGCVECGWICGDGQCEFGESCSNCPEDCGTCQFCKEPWYGHVCCQVGDPCGYGADDVCDCMGACDWEVSACGVNVCTDGVCGPMESCETCPGDCGTCAICGDGTCTSDYENAVNCPDDCPVISCSQRCTYDSGQTCQCDNECHHYNDCCPDKVEFCGSCGDGVCDPDEPCPPDCEG